MKFLKVVNHPTLKNLSVVSLGNLVNSGLGFLLLILVSRQLGPAQFGVFSVIFGFFTLISKLGDLGSNHTAIKYISYYKSKNNTKKVNEINGFFIGITYLFIVISLVFLLPLHRVLADILQIPQYSNVLLLSILFSAGLVMFNTYSIILQSLENFTDYVYLYSLTTLVKFFPILWVYFFVGLSLYSTLAIYITAPLIGSVFMYLFIKKRISINLKPNLSKTALKSITPFFYFLAIASITGALAEQLGVFISSVVLDSYQTGLYSAANKLSMVFGLLAGSIGVVLVPRASRYSDLKNIKKFAKKSLILGLFIFLFILPIVFFPKVFIYFTSGPNYYEAANVLIILSLAGGLGILRGTFATIFFSLGKAQYFAIKGVLLLLLDLPLSLFLANMYGINGIAYSKLVVSIFLTVLSVYMYLHYIKKLKN